MRKGGEMDLKKQKKPAPMPETEGNSEEKMSIGIEGLDIMLEGGIPRNHAVLAREPYGFDSHCLHSILQNLCFKLFLPVLIAFKDTWNPPQ
jgi:hypothetical protein